MALNPPPMPVDTALVEENRTMNWFWVQFFTSQQAQVQASAQTITDVQLSAQSAAIAATPLSVGTGSAAYRISVIARITVPASVSSSLQPTIRWTTGGVAQSKTWTALTGNTTTTQLVENVPIRIDALTSLTYETAYVSVGTAMQYGIEIIAERLG